MRFERWAKLRHFSLAVAIEEHGSILRAARSLNLSQPTASKLLQDVEDALKAPLFSRGNRGVQPTEIGREFVRHGRVILAQLNQTAQTLDAMSTGALGRVTLGTLLTASSYLLPTAVARLWKNRPQISIRIIEGTSDRLVPRLLSGELDFFLGKLSETRYRNEIDQTPLYPDELCVVARAGHQLAAMPMIPLEALAQADWILPPRETTLRRQFEQLFHDAGLDAPHARVESLSFLTNRRLLLDTDMLSVWSRSVAERDAMDRERIAILPVSIASTAGWIGISRRRGMLLSPAAEIVISELTAVASEITPPA